MTDLEGVSGVNGCADDSVGNRIANKEAANHLLVEEINAVVAGLVDAGAEEITVVDGHGGSDSISIEALHQNASLYVSRGGLAPVNIIDSSYDATLHIGTHAMMGVADGFLNHTFNSHAVDVMKLNGEPVGEIAIEALICAYFGVPTVLISGDKAACREAKEFLAEVETVETKTGISRYTVLNRNPLSVREELRMKARKALLEKNSFSIKRINPPYSLEIRLMCPNQADSYEMRGAKRLDHQTVLLQSDDFMDLWAQRNGWAPGVHNACFGIRSWLKDRK